MSPIKKSGSLGYLFQDSLDEVTVTTIDLKAAVMLNMKRGVAPDPCKKLVLTRGPKCAFLSPMGSAFFYDSIGYGRLAGYRGRFYSDLVTSSEKCIVLYSQHHFNRTPGALELFQKDWLSQCFSDFK